MAPDNTKSQPIIFEELKAPKFISSVKEIQSSHIGSRAIPNILEHIGNTPLVRLNKIPQSFGIKCQVYAKCEYYGPGGSHKDRIALRMIEDAEKSGKLLPGGTIIEPTSGNTGIGIAIVAAVKGYKCIFTMTEKNSQEKVETLAALGAKIIKTPGLPLDHPNSYISIARRLQKETPNSIMLDQYVNPGNPGAHYDETGVEILNQCNGKVDMLVAGAGTGGVISGLAKRMKENSSNCLVIGVDPEGSLLAEPQILNETETKVWEVEGIGHNDFTPSNLDKTLIDKWYKTNDVESLQMARRLIQEEGLLVGGSCGAALCGALKAIKDSNLSENHKCVVIFPDSIRNYMTKFLTKNWMLEKDLLDSSIIENSQNYSWWESEVSELNLKSPISIVPEKSISDAVSLMKLNNIEHLPVVDSLGTIKGVITYDGIMSKALDKKIQNSDSVQTVMLTKYKKMRENCKLSKLAHVLQGGSFALVISESNVIRGIVTQKDLSTFIF